MMLTIRFAASIVLMASFAPVAVAGDRFPLYWIGPIGQGFRGPAGDVDGNGMADVLFVAGVSPTSTSPQQLFVRSGANGSLLHAWTPSLPNYVSFSPAVIQSAAGDLNLDGFDDIALSIHPVNGIGLPLVVEVRSGQDGSVMGIIYPPPISNATSIGFGISGVGDLDGDSWPELLVSGLYQNAQCPTVYNFEGPALSFQYLPAAQCGLVVFGRLDDVDGDGFPDFYAGAPMTNVGALGNAGWIGIFSGGGGFLITSLNGTIANDLLGGGGLVALSDVTGDGLPELAATRSAGPDLVEVFSLPTFSTVYTIPASSMAGPNGEILQIDALGDGDGDGQDDILVRWRMLPVSEGITAFSGPTGSPIGQVSQNVPGSLLYPFGGLGDVNGDGLGDFAATPGVCAACVPPIAAQSLWTPWTWPVTSFAPTVYVARNFDLGNTPTVGGTAQFEVVAPRRAGKPFQIAFSQDFVFPGIPLGPFLFPLAMDSLFWASLSLGIGGTLDATGHGTVTLPIPNDPALHGAVVQASGVVYDSAGPLGIGCVLTQLPVPIQ